ncbi:hypothetical protein FEM48_Zijuj07G0024600 [Ziziphus jujuba var. spinosa]|uniref:Uncharacterized protein n=1 Tax=Ziziphus jujuba var. spinosa TaxID=714518 RepID=A0A978V1X5_ZIZJJ|nr:hypothetical protein FEM48_Zijuj07G0024600 [Ziziphus jujuba var. spinosa]
MQRVSSKFYKRKRDGQGFHNPKVEFEESNNFFQCGDYAKDRFKDFDKERKQVELETIVAPVVTNVVDELRQKDPALIKKFVHDFVGFCE